jgi:hypothetical protein
MCKSKPLAVTYERCHELLEICEPSDPEKHSGFKWKVNRGTRGRAGEWAGYLNVRETSSGGIRKDWMVKIDDKLYKASRIIYFMHHGVDPYPMEVDHEDVNSLNNRVDNLRLAGRRLQCQSQGIRSDNKSGVRGVRWIEERSKWRVEIKVDNKLKHLGYFATLKEAAEARNAAVREYWPKEAWKANLIATGLL